jgi:N-glycosylase/DNA lyase
MISEWLVDNIKGISWKEASHFLRNLGYEDFAILDVHVLNLLKCHGLIKEIPKNISNKNGKSYLAIENQLKALSEKMDISMAELDVYMFYLDSEKICKK